MKFPKRSVKRRKPQIRGAFWAATPPSLPPFHPTKSVYLTLKSTFSLPALHTILGFPLTAAINYLKFDKSRLHNSVSQKKSPQVSFRMHHSHGRWTYCSAGSQNPDPQLKIQNTKYRPNRVRQKAIGRLQTELLIPSARLAVCTAGDFANKTAVDSDGVIDDGSRDPVGIELGLGQRTRGENKYDGGNKFTFKGGFLRYRPALIRMLMSYGTG